MSKLFEKIQIWHIIFAIAVQIAFFVMLIGAGIEWKSNITNDVNDVQIQIKTFNSKLNELTLTDEKVRELNKRLDEVNKKLDDFNKEILDIYKRKQAPGF